MGAMPIQRHEVEALLSSQSLSISGLNELKLVQSHFDKWFFHCRLCAECFFRFQNIYFGRFAKS